MKTTIRLMVIAMTVVWLNGCAMLTSEFPLEVKEPRPFTMEQSYAMTKFLQIPSMTDLAKDCAIDTAIWPDEKGVVNGGFLHAEVHSILHGHRDTMAQLVGLSSVERDVKNLIKKRGTIPTYIRGRMDNLGEFGKNSPSTSELASDALNAFLTVKTGSGFIGFGSMTNIAMENAAVWGSIADCYSNFHLVYKPAPAMLKSIKASIPGYETLHPLLRDHALKAKVYEQMKAWAFNALQTAGFRIVEKEMLLTDKKDCDWLDFYQRQYYNFAVLENEALGCPKYEKGMRIEKTCRLQYTNRPDIHVSVNDAEDTASTSRIRLDFPSGFSDDLVAEQKEKFAQLIVDQAQSVYFYVPYLDHDGKWNAQYILDNQGKHYFVVPVKGK